MADASPKLRSNLTATAVEADGVAYVDVGDPQTGQSFRFYDFEYALALQLNGQPVTDIAAWAVAAYGLELTPAGVVEFADRLAELGFLEAPAPAESEAEQQAVVVELGPDDLFEESQPVSQVVNRAVSQVAPAPAAEPSPFPTSSPTLSHWPADLSGNQGRERATPLRGMAAEPAGTDTLMGFAGLAVLRDKPVEPPVASPPPNGQTVMGFAAVSRGDVPEPPPPGALERRQPPAPDNVLMAPFEDEVARHERRPVAVRAQPREDGRGLSLTAVMWIVVIIAAAAAVGYYIWSRQQVAIEPRQVRVVAPRPSAVYRWFDAVGAVVDGDVRGLSFTSAGVVAEVLPAKTRFAAGDVVAKLQGVVDREAEVNRHRSRVGYYEQLRDSMKAAGKLAERRQAEAKLAQKKSLLDEAQAALDQLLVRAAEPGEIVEVAARAGAQVAAGTPVVRVKSGGLRAEFALPSHDVETAAHLGFCRIEVVGGAPPAAAATPSPGAARGAAAAADPGTAGARFADCKIGGMTGGTPGGGAGGKQQVELGGSDLPVGQPLRLARSRYDGVFPVPRASVVRVGDTDRVFVVGQASIAEARAVTLADASPDEALVSQGIDVGDQVIADPPADLRDGEAIEIQK